MIRRPPRSTLSSSSAASDVYKRQVSTQSTGDNSWRHMGCGASTVGAHEFDAALEADPPTAKRGSIGYLAKKTSPGPLHGEWRARPSRPWKSRVQYPKRQRYMTKKDVPPLRIASILTVKG
eukprot:TRINITY_DN24_c0_g1_i6.p1 TRINITY_DN24_c0_g1~~TRINITY_DN24_c0_g1_i6.p1  ORF type:complete len:121 (-),score=13.22 TRINITY_DN24_c0_g1_i6:327-689(-)